MSEWVKCATQAQFDAAVKVGDCPIVRSGFFEAYGSASVRAYGSASVEAYDSANVQAHGSASVEAYGSASVEAAKYVAVHRFGTTPTVTGGVLIQVPDLTDLTNWLDYYGLTPSRGSVVVYKAVSDDYTSGRGMRYAVGEKVTATDRDGRNACGGGLHFSPSPRHARRYHTGATRFLAWRVRLADTVVVGVPSDADKVKAKSCTVLYEVDIDGNRIEVAA